MRILPWLGCLLALPLVPLLAQEPGPPTHADTLRGSIGPGRGWWNVTFYDLHVTVSPSDSSIRGWNGISYRVTGPAREMQLDLNERLTVDSVVQDGKALTWRREHDVFFVTLRAAQPAGGVKTVTAYYHGKPQVAKRPPWDGGFVWASDSLGRTWIATACQGDGASLWWPNKDTQADEPDSQRVAITIPDSMVDVSNGRLRSVAHHDDGTTTWEWFVTEPINNYDVVVNAGGYAHFTDLFRGEGGILTLNYWPLSPHLEAAQHQFEQVKPMLTCFEHWFGPYPWYRDGYQLVESPHLGMEHQSAVAYGNHYQNGYLGRDLSHTGKGLAWDFIIVHESAHEWFGNSITSADVADMWVHESFANYAEGLYTECQQGKDAASTYVIGTRQNVTNQTPIIAEYGVNREGSGDMYYKGGNMLNTIRHIINDDDRWRQTLRGLNQTFRHSIVTGRQIEDYISQHAGIDLSTVFAQYLTTTKIPAFEYRIAGDSLSYRWANTVPGFSMPLPVMLTDGNWTVLHPGTEWKTAPLRLEHPEQFRVDSNFYVDAKRLTP